MASQPVSWENALSGFNKLANELLIADGEYPQNIRAVGLICEILEAQLGCFMSFSRESMVLASEKLWQDGTLTHSAITYSLDSVPSTSIIHEVLNNQHAHFLDQSNELDPFIVSVSAMLKTPMGPSMIVPVMGCQEVVGMLLVGRLKGQLAFDASEVVLFETLASLLSLQLQNTLLKQQIGSLSGKLSRVDAQLLQSAKLAATGKLAASIAHEINNPLQSVQSCIYLVADGMTDSGPNKQYLDIARDELDRIAKIVQRLADLYRPSQEGRGPTDINGLLENVLALMDKRLQQSNVDVTRSLAPNLPSVTVVADQIKQVSFNLLLNATEAMPEGGHLHVATRLVQDSQQPRLEIIFEDSGVGIAPEAIERVFDPFYTTKAKGTGLGLSISHDIIERHGGSIHIESKVGRGSIFIVNLPIASFEDEE